jgi:hypothetical protein
LAPAGARPTSLDHKAPFLQLASHDRGELLHVGSDVIVIAGRGKNDAPEAK